jgi:hypothetical protein
VHGALLGSLLLTGCYNLSALTTVNDMAGADAWNDLAAPASDQGGGNLLANGDFEVGLGSWQWNFSSVTWSGEGHSGAHSAQICPMTDGSLSNFFTDLPASPGVAYDLNAWVRLDPPSGVIAHAVLFVYGAQTSQPSVQANSVADWQPLSVTFAGDPAATSLEIDFLGMSPGGDGGLPCFLVDDVSLTAR